MFDRLEAADFQIEFHSHAQAILEGDFPEAAVEIENVLVEATIPIEEIIAGGGGEAKGTQRLRRGLQAKKWETVEFVVEKRINGVPREAISHKMDHVTTFNLQRGGAGVLALEIEWNNKDPFYDRDLENFKRLHADGAISVGMIVTRGRALHESMRSMVERFFDECQISSFDDLLRFGYDPTARQRKAIMKRVERDKNPLTFRESFVSQFVSDKFGEATTHWRKLEDRVHRGVGNPCPLVLIGLPPSIVSFDYEGEDLQQIVAASGASASESE